MNEIVLSVALPLLAAFVLPPVMRTFMGLGLWIGPGVLVYGLWLLGDAWLRLGDSSVSIAIGGFAPPLGINFYIDRLALMLAFASQLFGLLLWPFRIDRDTARRQSLMLILIASSCGLALSGDLFNLYVFYELAAVASFGLVASANTGAAHLATLRYLLLSGLGSVLILLGVTLVYARTGSLNLAQLAQLAPQALDNPTGMAAFLAILIGVGVKAELFPVNSWVPEVYATAPARVSAMLAGVVSKLAVVVVVRLLILIFPQPEAAQVLLLLGMFGVISGELAAWRARDVRRMLAYSSIGQLGVIFIAFSIPGDGGLYAGLALVLHHMLVKPGLFLLTERWGGALHGLRGAGLAAPVAGGLFLLFSLSLVGVPPLPGFWAKYLLVTQLIAQSDPLHLTALVVFLAATVVEASYLFRVAGELFRSDTRKDRPPPPAPESLGLVTSELIGAGLLLGMLTIAPLTDNLKAVAARSGDVAAYTDTVFPASGGANRP